MNEQRWRRALLEAAFLAFWIGIGIWTVLQQATLVAFVVGIVVGVQAAVVLIAVVRDRLDGAA